MAAPRTLVAPPKRDKREGGLATVAEFRTNERLGAAEGLQYDPEVCGLAVGSIQLCYGPAVNPGVNEVQTVTITGTPTGGTFRLTWNGQQTAVIAYNATAATVQAALEALSNIGVGNVSVTGGPGPGTPYVVTFVGQFASENVSQMTATHTFTGGTTPAIAVATTTPGAAPTDKVVGGLGTGASVVPNFGGYIGVECFLHGDPNEYGPRAQQALELAQDRLIEGVLWGWITAAAATGTAVGLAAGIALAEENADVTYVGRPVIHMSRQDAVTAFAAGVLAVREGRLLTPNDSPVVASGAYATGIIGVTGGITVEQSSIRVSPGLNYTKNTMLAIAERVYGLIVDCDYRAEYTIT
jgi:hypothetical protein